MIDRSHSSCCEGGGGRQEPWTNLLTNKIWTKVLKNNLSGFVLRKSDLKPSE